MYTIIIIMIYEVELSRQVRKQLRKVPRHVLIKLMAWVDAVESEGLPEVRKTPGFHDQPLQGQRAGQRSIRLSKAYCAIYRCIEDGSIELIMVDEVNKHEY